MTNNKNKKNLLKKILATTSALAVITGASNSAMGAGATDTNNNVTFINGGGVGLKNVFNNNDNFYFSNGGLDLTTGGDVTIGSIDLNNKAPAVAGFTVAHDVIGKAAKVNAKIPGLTLPSEKAKLQRTFYNVGASVNATYGAMDYGISANANFANKYFGVQGSVKVRVNF